MKVLCRSTVLKNQFFRFERNNSWLEVELVLLALRAMCPLPY